jgi:hypothetical protein
MRADWRKCVSMPAWTRSASRRDADLIGVREESCYLVVGIPARPIA